MSDVDDYFDGGSPPYTQVNIGMEPLTIDALLDEIARLKEKYPSLERTVIEARSVADLACIIERDAGIEVSRSDSTAPSRFFGLPIVEKPEWPADAWRITDDREPKTPGWR